MTAKGDDNKRLVPIVGVGSSAGGLEAMRSFLGALPPDLGAAYVLLTHHRAGHTSVLSQLLSNDSPVPVRDIEEATELEPDVVYIAPPGRYLQLDGNVVTPVDPPPGDTGHSPIDYFLRPLAGARRERAIGVLLSGTGSDGTLGLQAIKGAGGMTMVQDPATAQYGPMAQSAMGARAVDLVLPPQEMAGEIASYLERVSRSPASDAAREVPAQFEAHASTILRLLHEHAGADFSDYKRSTVHRRIQRRMALHHLESFADYIEYLRSTPHELDLLAKELLIGVTSFFRDPEAFAALAAGPLRALLHSTPADHAVRVWVPGCSTGEEAYSLAILLRECMDSIGQTHDLQIFGTDLDVEAIDQARAGTYPATIATDVGEERLHRYFVPDGDRYRVRGDIRDSIVFAPQNVLQDPPFTRLDLLSCRNLLIYLQPTLQKQLLHLFHYALRPGGILMLGTSESIGHGETLFDVSDTKHKIFIRRQAATPDVTTLPMGGSATTRRPAHRTEGDRTVSSLAAQAMLEHLVPPSVLVNERGEIVHIHGRTGMFLEPSPGPQSRVNVISMAREGLGGHLTMALRQAVADQGEEIVKRKIRVRANGDAVHTDLRVGPVRKPEALRGLYLVSFENTAPAEAVEPAPASDAPAPDRSRVQGLERELQRERESHQAVIEELEAANEELKSTNEELQSTNEELQSTNEELETSKEEMQSLNEELQTVNVELEDKLKELSRANDDMTNLLDSTDIATVFLDHELRVKRFTDKAQHIINLIPSDIGRPISDLSPRLRYERFVDDAREVLRTLVFQETEVQAEDGAWYLMRILPYRTTDNVIDGLVITFVDITAIKGLERSERDLREALATSHTTAYGLAEDGSVRWVFRDVLGVPRTRALGARLSDLTSNGEAVALMRQVLDRGLPAHGEISTSGEDGANVYHLYMVPSADETARRTGVTCVQTTISEANL